jgi:hypothetical protein
MLYLVQGGCLIDRYFPFLIGRLFIWFVGFLISGFVSALCCVDFNLDMSECRASLIYNVNILGKGVVSMGGKALNMLEIANAHHVAFGQFPYHSE